MRDDLTARVWEIINRYNMFPAACRIGVAVSGGADSVVLLHVLHRLRPRFAAELTVLHVNHGLRGAESDGDEAFVRELARELGLRFVSARREPEPGNLEQSAREARRAFFREQNLDRLALGHTRSDQAETVLFRLLRGSGTAGLSGMRFATNDGFVRPLLGCGREEIRAWARAEGICWREDSSNANTTFMRNSLRLETMPLLAERYNPQLEPVLAATAELAQGEEDFWEPLVGSELERMARPARLGLLLDGVKLRELHPALERRVLREALRRLIGNLRSIDLQHIEGIRAICRSTHGHDRVMIPGCDAVRSYESLLLAKPGALDEKRGFSFAVRPNEALELPFKTGYFVLESANREASFCASFKGDPLHTETADIDPDLLKEGASFELRNWEPGDHILLEGRQRPEKLKTLFQEHRTLLWERRHWPVLVLRKGDGGEQIVWTRQFGRALWSGDTSSGAGSRVAEGPRRMLRLRYSVVGI